MNLPLSELAVLVGGELEGDPSFRVQGAAGLAEAGAQDVSFLGNSKYADQAKESRAGCLLLPKVAKGQPGRAPNRIYVDDPQWAFAQVLRLLEPELSGGQPATVHPKAEVHAEARLGRGVSVGPFAVVARGASVGDGTRIGAQCFIGDGARVGRDCLLHPQVVVRERCTVGDRVIVHSGTVLGSDGFGFSTDPKTGGHRKIPQIGIVSVEDDVEIGSNVSVDRATVGVTRIGAGTKIDNLVQIAHNVQIGRNCLIVSQAGIAGSTRLGDRVILAGQAGVIGHLSLGDGAVVTAQSGVMHDVEPKAVVFGSPARPHREGMRLLALFARLPELFEAVKELKSAGKDDKREEEHAKP